MRGKFVVLLLAVVAACMPATARADDRIPAVVTAVQRGVGNACRNVHKDDLCSVADGRVAGPAHINAYETSWVHRALTLQRQLGDAAPLAQQTIPHTHNSFNSSVYAPPTLTNQDANQIYSMTDQLRMDIRAIEMDVHWVPSIYGKTHDGLKAVTLCHGKVVNGIHVGCTIDRPLTSGLGELRTWLDQPENHDEFVLLYLENNLDGNDTAHDAVARALTKYLGNLVERPVAGKGCQALPTEVTPAQLRARGHRVLITGNCGNNAWNSWVFERGPDSNWRESSSGKGNDYPGLTACGKEANNGHTIHRWWDDSTFLSTLAGGTRSDITPTEAAAMARCGATLIGFDQLTPEDPRLAAVIWSWTPNEPANRAPACASSGTDARFHARSCGAQLAFACQRGVNEWRVSTGRGSFANPTCDAGFRFAVPRNGYQNSLLRAAAGGQDVWVRYADTSGRGDWRG